MQALAELEIKDDVMNGVELLSDASVRESVQLLKLLADETRLRILYLLQRREELNVLELCRLLGQRQPSVSHHLALMRGAGLIDMRRDGKHNFYRVVPERFEQVVASVFQVTPGTVCRSYLESYESRYGDLDGEDKSS